jgi:hypothetical protein
MPRFARLSAVFVIASAVTASPASTQSADVIVKSAVAYVTSYEKAFSMLVSEEMYVQEVQRPTGGGGNLSRSNPGGGMQASGNGKRQILKSDYMLVQLGDGSGWMPFRDTFELNGSKLRDREDRLLKLFLSNDVDRFDQASRIMAESTRYNIGNVNRTINIPTLAMMFLHPSVRERFAFEPTGEETIAGRAVQRLHYRETARPTLIKTTRGADLALDGSLWIDPASGAVVKSVLNAADPAVRASVTVTFRLDEGLAIWVPAQMDEYYKAASSADEIIATATYSKVRRFQVSTDEKIAKPPGR